MGARGRGIWNIDDLRNSHISQTKDARYPSSDKTLTVTGMSSTRRDLITIISMTPGQVRYVSSKIEKAAARTWRNDHFITPLDNKPEKVQPFYTMDIETMEGSNGEQIPVLITFSTQFNTEFFIINKNLDYIEGVEDLWYRYTT